MRFNDDNIEAWMLDYFEGRLDKATANALKDYVESNPRLRGIFGDYEPLVLDPAEVKFHDKDSLKKPVIISVGHISEHNREEYFINHTEGNLNLGEQTDLKQFLQKNPSLQREFRLYSIARLEPDLTLEFPGKESLKKSLYIKPGGILRKLFAYSAAAAAVVVLVISSVLFRTAFHNEIPPAYSAAVSPNPFDNAVRQLTEKQDGMRAVDNIARFQTMNNKSADGTGNIRNSIQIALMTSHRVNVLPDNAQTPEIAGSRDDMRDILAFQKLKLIRKESEKAASDYASSLDTASVNRPQPRINFWNVAGAGVAAYNILTGDDVVYQHESADDGKLKSFVLGNSISYRRNKK